MLVEGWWVSRGGGGFVVIIPLDWWITGYMVDS
jgi:hypothetical protein